MNFRRDMKKEDQHLEEWDVARRLNKTLLLAIETVNSEFGVDCMDVFPSVPPRDPRVTCLALSRDMLLTTHA
jgi:hypothetical protein